MIITFYLALSFYQRVLQCDLLATHVDEMHIKEKHTSLM